MTPSSESSPSPRPGGMREEGVIWSGEFQAMYAAFIGILGVLLQLKDDSPFKTHHANAMASLVATCVYFSAVLLPQMRKRMQQSKHSPIFNHVIHIIAALSPVCLVSIFLPNCLRYLVLSAWTLISAIVLIRSLFPDACDRFYQNTMNACDWFYQNTRNAASRLLDVLRRLMGRSSMEPGGPGRLPV